MPFNKNRTLTVLGVKDFLGKALKEAEQGFDRLDKKGDKLNLKLVQVAGRFGGLAKTAFKVTAAAGTATIGVLGAATARAKEFRHEFLELENLNLDKSRKQIRTLEGQALKAAFAIGRAPAEASKAFFDVQSGTGKFGGEVDRIVRSTGRFAQAVKVDFNTQVDAAVKGIRNFNLEAADMDRFFASSFKTVQTGIVTFGQLARVQTDYAGAAATANQNVDSANKLFSIFTTRAKSAEEAATLTKSAFTDLLKPSTLKTFRKFGVKVFDEQTGRVKQLDDIVGQLNARFKKLGTSDRQLTSLVNQFKGSEGLVALVGAVAKNGDQMLDTFRQFDRTEFNLEKALRNSRADLTTMSNIVKNKLDVLLTRIGFKVVPAIVDGLEHFETKVLPGIERRMPAILEAAGRFTKLMGKGVDLIGKTLTSIDRGLEKQDMNRVITPKQNRENERRLVGELGFPERIKNADTRTKGFLARNFDPSIIGDEAAIQRFSDKIKRLDLARDRGTRDLLTAILAGKQSSRLDDILAAADRLDKKAGMPTPKTTTGGTPANAGMPVNTGVSPLSNEIKGVVSGGPQTKHITVNIQQLNGIQTMEVTQVKERLDDLKRAVTEVLVGAVNDAELVLGN